MVKPLQNRVEKFLSSASILAFAYRDKPAIFSFLFEKQNKEVFSDKKNHEDLRDFFRGKKLKLVIHTPDYIKTTVSLVDIETADSLILDGPKFVANNIALFAEAKLPEDTTFVVNLLCPGEKTIGYHEYWKGKKPLEIHGYSLIDSRSAQ